MNMNIPTNFYSQVFIEYEKGNMPKEGTKRGKMTKIFFFEVHRDSSKRNPPSKGGEWGVHRRRAERNISEAHQTSNYQIVAAGKRNSSRAFLVFTEHRATGLRKQGKGQSGWMVSPQVWKVGAGIDSRENLPSDSKTCQWGCNQGYITHSFKFCSWTPKHRKVPGIFPMLWYQIMLEGTSRSCPQNIWSQWW